MNPSVEAHLHRLIEDEDLPDGIMKQADAFFLAGDLHQLLELPIAPDEMVEAGQVLMSAPSIRQYAETSGRSRDRCSASGYPTLSESLRGRLVELVRAENEHTEAALFLLSHDLRARACNGVAGHGEG